MLKRSFSFKQRITTLLSLVATLFLLAIPAAASAVASDNTTNKDAVTNYCLKNAPAKARDACRGSQNIEMTRNAAAWHCKDQPVDGGKKADCIDRWGISLMKDAIAKKPKSVNDFENKLTAVLTADIQKTGGSLTSAPAGTNKAQTPTEACGKDATCPVIDPAACAADPTLDGCTSDPDAICNKNTCDFVKKYINPAISTVSIIFGLIIVISLIAGGIQYSASAGDPSKVSAAKKRITMTIVALICYAFLYGFLQFLVPGGIF